MLLFNVYDDEGSGRSSLLLDDLIEEALEGRCVRKFWLIPSAFQKLIYEYRVVPKKLIDERKMKM